MNSDAKMPKGPLELLTDALAEDILSLPSDELREELMAEGSSVATEANAFDAVLGRARSAAGKSELERARAAVARLGRDTSKSRRLDPAEAQRRYEELLQSTKNDGVTLAARKGAAASEADMLSVLEDLADLKDWKDADEPKP